MWHVRTLNSISIGSLEETSWTPSYQLVRATDSDVQSVNIGIHSAWSKASDRARSGEYYRRHGNTPIMGHATEE